MLAGVAMSSRRPVKQSPTLSRARAGGASQRPPPRSASRPPSGAAHACASGPIVKRTPPNPAEKPRRSIR